jgi:DNA-binding MarR family transcriptional regulator/N-acetylglutamate synthase-like GNAT family acetyltransferase
MLTPSRIAPLCMARHSTKPEQAAVAVSERSSRGTATVEGSGDRRPMVDRVNRLLDSGHESVERRMRFDVVDRRIAAVRRFNRFYTQKIGVLQEGLLQSPFSLTEVRVLYELAHRDEPPSAARLSSDLGLDPGYLSRILRSFARRALVARRISPSDRREALLSLTAKGRRALGPLEVRSSEEIRRLLGQLSEPQQARVVASMAAIEHDLGAGREEEPYVLRPHRPGDIGWVIERHGALYAEEYSFDEQFEALVARIAARFLERYDVRRERCWIAERHGERIGSVFVVRHTRTVAKLRMLLVEPRARGLGLGARLVDECIRFARDAGYARLTLWTQSILRAARHLYARAGFRLVHEERQRAFGQDLVSETWELRLR